MIKYNPDWATFTLKDVCTRITDGSHYSPKSVENGLPMASVKDLTPFGINLESCRLISKDDFSALAYQDCKPIVGDVLISKDGASALDTVCEVKQEVDVVLLSSVAILRPDINKIIPAYLRYYLDAESTRKYLKDVFITGAAIPRIVLKDFKRAEIRLPPLPEQRAIARILGSLDDKIELNRRMNETLESIARAIFKSWFVDFDPVRAKSEGREPVGMDAETAALFPDSFEETELGMVPNGWRIGCFDETIELIGGGTPKTSEPEYWNGDIPWFSIVDSPENSNVFVIDTEKKITKRGLEESSTRLLLKGTTIITARGTVGKCALVGNPMTMNQSCYGVHAKDQRGDYFNYFALKNLVSELQRSTHGSVFDTITGETFKSVRTVIVPVELTRIFDKKISSFMEQILSSLQESETLVLLRNALLPKLLSGEIRLNDSEMLKEANQWT